MYVGKHSAARAELRQREPVHEVLVKERKTPERREEFAPRRRVQLRASHAAHDGLRAELVEVLGIESLVDEDEDVRRHDACLLREVLHELLQRRRVVGEFRPAAERRHVEQRHENQRSRGSYKPSRSRH